MLLNSILTISSKAMSRYPTGIAVTSEGLWGGSPAASDAIAFAGNGSPIAVFNSALDNVQNLRTCIRRAGHTLCVLH
jgi:hypothetical protein